MHLAPAHRRFAVLLASAALLGGCAGNPIDETRGTVIPNQVTPTPDNPSGSVYYDDDDGRAYRCNEGIIFDC